MTFAARVWPAPRNPGQPGVVATSSRDGETAFWPNKETRERARTTEQNRKSVTHVLWPEKGRQPRRFLSPVPSTRGEVYATRRDARVRTPVLGHTRAFTRALTASSFAPISTSCAQPNASHRRTPKSGCSAMTQPAVIEGSTIATLQIGFSRQALCQQNIMFRQFHGDNMCTVSHCS